MRLKKICLNSSASLLANGGPRVHEIFKGSAQKGVTEGLQLLLSVDDVALISWPSWGSICWGGLSMWCSVCIHLSFNGCDALDGGVRAFYFQKWLHDGISDGSVAFIGEYFILSISCLFLTGLDQFPLAVSPHKLDVNVRGLLGTITARLRMSMLWYFDLIKSTVTCLMFSLVETGGIAPESITVSRLS